LESQTAVETAVSAAVVAITAAGKPCALVCALEFTAFADQHSAYWLTDGDGRSMVTALGFRLPDCLQINHLQFGELPGETFRQSL
jgi:hypothetical protein